MHIFFCGAASFPRRRQCELDASVGPSTFFAQDNQLPRDEVIKLLDVSEKQIENEPRLMEVDTRSRHINVTGDLHGQIQELLAIFTMAAQPSKTNPYLFNGDFGDRGSYAVEVVLILLGSRLLLTMSTSTVATMSIYASVNFMVSRRR